MKNNTHPLKQKQTFKEAVESTAEVQHCHQEGKQAILKEERNKVEMPDPRKCGGSLFIDDCLLNQGLYPQDNR